MKLIRFIKEWTLVISILVGVLAYFVFIAIPFPPAVHHFANQTVSIVQPLLLFSMLFLTYCRINPHDLRLCRWHLWVLALQAGFFIALAIILIFLPAGDLRIILEGAMLCLICPTATAGAVITGRLGGNINNITTYTILINILVSILIPTFVPFVHPNPELGFVNSSLLILGKVFPLLLLPLISAFLLRFISPSLTEKFANRSDLSFYLWAVALALAITVTTRSIMHADLKLSTELWLVVVSLISCALQFWLGRKIGYRYNDTITAGQAFGQKNTVLAIWMGYTFFTPITSIVGGFYSIWHNIVNSYQLYRHEHT
ncbi:MAG: transporter [Muribaculaceae bacterium]|nr:transporter [Muribaculaceae bacterium]